MIKTSYRLIVTAVTAALLGIGMTGHDAPIESSARALLFRFLPKPQVSLPLTALHAEPDSLTSYASLLTATQQAAVKSVIWVGALPSDRGVAESAQPPTLLFGLPATPANTTGAPPWHHAMVQLDIDATKRAGAATTSHAPSWWWPTPTAGSATDAVHFAPWQTPTPAHDPITFGFGVAGSYYASLSTLAALSLNGKLHSGAPLPPPLDQTSAIAWNDTTPEWEGTVQALLEQRIPPQHLRDRHLLLGESGAVAATLARISALQDRWSRVELLPGGYSYQAIGLLVIGALFLLWPLSAQWRLQVVASLLLLVVLLNLQFMSLTTQRLWLPATMPALLILLLATVRLWFAALWRWEGRLRFQADNLRMRLASELILQRKLDAAMHQLMGCAPRPEVWRSLYDLAREFEIKRAWSAAKKIYQRIAEHNPAFHDTRERLAKIDQTLLDATIISPPRKLGDTLITGDADHPAPTLGRYQLTREIGRGAMGVVYEGVDPHIGRKVAIKTLMLSEEFRGEALEEASARFYREAKAVGRLNHPHIVTVFDVGEEASLSYIAMDYVDGESLDLHTSKGKLLPMPEVINICQCVADALDYAHSRNVIHRDIKPGNIIYNALTKTVKVTDFGVASLTDDSRTRTGTVLGTPSYMSPEQINGQRVDGRADIFSLGVTLYELLTGTLPFQGDNLSALFNKILHQPPPSLRKARTDTPIALSRLVGRALRKEPDKRFQTAGELVQALNRLQESIG